MNMNDDDKRLATVLLYSTYAKTLVPLEAAFKASIEVYAADKHISKDELAFMLMSRHELMKNAEVYEFVDMIIEVGEEMQERLDKHNEEIARVTGIDSSEA